MFGTSRQLFGLCAAAAFVLCAGLSQTARADQVSFVTSATFIVPAGSPCTGGGTNTVTCSNGTSLSFTGASFSSQVGAPAFPPFGTFTLVTNSVADSNILDGITFNMVLQQSSPTVGSFTLTGTIDSQTNTFYPLLDFVTSRFVIGNVTYETFDGLFVQTTTLSGTVTAPVPEPATLLLLAGGLSGLVLKRGRRRRKD